MQASTHFGKRAEGLVIAFLLVGWAPQLQGQAAQVAEPKRKFLIPFMWHGPNNQINAVKETLALGRLLGRAVAVPDLQQHLFTDKNEEPMRFGDLFDLPYMQAHLDLIPLAELTAALPSWSQKLDAVVTLVLPEKVSVKELAGGLGLETPAADRWFDSPVSSLKGCTKEGIRQLADMLAPYDVVGVQTFHGLLYGSHWLAGPMGLACSDPCCTAFQATAVHVRKAPSLYELADTFIRQRFGSVDFVAAHVRPYPDPCVRVWTQHQEETQLQPKMDEYCNNEFLYSRFGPCIRSLMQQYGVSRLFVMTHPLVRSIVRDKLRALDVEPVFMELEDVRTAGGGGGGGNVSFSQLAMVEEAVCTRAKVFVGTKESSMTGTIIQDRFSHTHELDTSYMFYRRIGYETKPLAVRLFYQQTNMTTTGTDRWRQKQAQRDQLRRQGLDWRKVERMQQRERNRGEGRQGSMQVDEVSSAQ